MALPQRRGCVASSQTLPAPFHEALRRRIRMKILMTGSTGLIGTALVTALAGDGQTVCRLIRAESAMVGQAPLPGDAGRRGGKNCCAQAGLRQREPWWAR